MKEKLEGVVDGRSDVRQYVILAKLVRGMSRIGLMKWIVRAVIGLGLYPSVLYTLYKDTVASGA